MPENPDLPQFTDDGSGWMEVTSAFQLSAYTLSVPIAIQLFMPERRVLTTGVITSTQDVYGPGNDPAADPTGSYIWFQGCNDPLFIDWSRTQAVLAMVGQLFTHEEA